MLYSVELNVSIDVDAKSRENAIAKAYEKLRTEVDLCDIRLNNVECLEEQDASDNEFARRVL